MALHVRNWAKFQHYRDRRPPWIKFYTELLDDPRFLALPDAAKGQLCALFLLAAKRENTLPDAPREIRVLVGATGKLYLDELVSAGWLVRDQSHASGDASNSASASASNLASKHASGDASIRARPRARERTEKEKEKETTLPTRPPAPAPARAFYSDPRVTAFFEHLNPRESTGWQARLGLWIEGEGWPAKRPTEDEIADGLVAAMTAKREGSLSEAWVRGCIRRAMEPREVTQNRAQNRAQNPRESVGDVVYRNALAATAKLAEIQEDSL